MHEEIAQAALGHSVWMGWNALLALVPLVLSRRLFHGDHQRNPAWWAGVAAFILFLPNAPYVLTDIIHLIEDVRMVQSDTVITLIVIPVYALFFLIGIEAYVLAVTELSHYLRRQGVARSGRLLTRLGLHLLCAIGIALGRIERLNSWDTVIHPMRLVDSMIDVLGQPLWLAAAFVAVTVVFNGMKLLTLAVKALWESYWTTPRQGLAGA